MKNLPFNLCIAFLVGFLMNFVTPAFSSPTPTPTATITPTPSVTATTIVTATPTPHLIFDCFSCDVSGYVTDARTGKGIKEATILIDGVKQTVTDETGYYDFTSYSDNYDTCSNLEVEVLADGYLSSTGSGEDEGFCNMTLNFELLQICSSANSITIYPVNIILNRKKSVEVTVTVKGENDCRFYYEPVIVSMISTSKKFISIFPKSAITDENGEATFTITAKNKTGNARVTFKAGASKKSIIIKVRR